MLERHGGSAVAAGAQPSASDADEPRQHGDVVDLGYHVVLHVDDAGHLGCCAGGGAGGARALDVTADPCLVPSPAAVPCTQPDLALAAASS